MVVMVMMVVVPPHMMVVVMMTNSDHDLGHFRRRCLGKPGIIGL
jgi:hypothetical protein